MSIGDSTFLKQHADQDWSLEANNALNRSGWEMFILLKNEKILSHNYPSTPKEGMEYKKKRGGGEFKRHFTFQQILNVCLCLLTSVAAHFYKDFLHFNLYEEN